MTAASTRRQFLRTGALAAGAMVMAGRARAVQGANDRLGIGLIGAGGRGNDHLRQLHWLKTQAAEPIEIVAVCDVYRPRADQTAVAYGAKAYMDHRDLLADKNVDVVCIATPDHHHAYQVIDAVEAGKDTYCEKPVTHWRQFDLLKRMRQAVKKSGRVFQLGTQAMSDSAWHQMKRLVQAGAIGRPLFGETGFFRIGDWGERGMAVDDPNAKPGKDLNWESFLGDAPKREFSVDRLFRWRLFEDYAGGPATDLYPHCLTQVIDILGVNLPGTVVALGGIHRYKDDLREVPDTINILADYPEKVSISMVGSQGNDYQGTGNYGSGARIPIMRGWDGTLTIQAKEIVLTYNADLKKEPKRFPIEKSEDFVSYWQHFLNCCRKRDTNTLSPVDLAYRTQTMLIMASLALRQGKVARFDASKEAIAM